MTGARFGWRTMTIAGGLALLAGVPEATRPAAARNPAMIPLGICTVIPENAQSLVFSRTLELCSTDLEDPMAPRVSVTVRLTITHNGTIRFTDSATFLGAERVAYTSLPIDCTTWGLDLRDEVISELEVEHVDGLDAGTIVTECVTMPVGAAQ